MHQICDQALYLFVKTTKLSTMDGKTHHIRPILDMEPLKMPSNVPLEAILENGHHQMHIFKSNSGTEHIEIWSLCLYLRFEGCTIQWIYAYWNTIITIVFLVATLKNMAAAFNPVILFSDDSWLQQFSLCLNEHCTKCMKWWWSKCICMLLSAVNHNVGSSSKSFE